MKKGLLIALCIITFCIQVQSQTTYKNPVIPGFYPDPSVCRVGNDYYLVNSSFGYFPGVPIFHSKDLINWEQIGYVLTRDAQLPLNKGRISTGGIFAPTIRYHNGLFYMITTNISILRNFYVTAKNPAGPWSDPIWVDLPSNAVVIDPSLFFDDNGKVYLTTSPGFTTTDGILLAQIDITTGKLLSPPTAIWPGTGGRYPEGPHIYKKDGMYYLMIAKGGTEYGHKMTIARSKSIAGPYTSDPFNPILTHINRNAQTNPIQGTGHADIVQAADGSWWMVALAFRPVNNHHTLGRETFVVPVEWKKNEWPVVNNNGTIALDMHAKTLPIRPYPEKPSRDDFDESELGFAWNFMNNPKMANYSLTEKNGYLKLKGDSSTLNELGLPTFVGRRQQHHSFTATTSVEYNPENQNEEAGLTVFMDTKYHYDLSVRNADGKRILILTYTLGLLNHTEKEVVLTDGPVELRVTGSPTDYQFLFKQGGNDFAELGKVNASFLSSESVGGFTGVFIGLFATGNGKASQADAYFDWFNYTHK